MERITATQLPRSAGSWRIAVMGPKGGSGKTPTAATLGLNLAGLRGEITAVVDANTHPGTLRSQLVPDGQEAPLPMLAMANLAATGQLLPEWHLLASYSDLVGRLRVFTNTGVEPRLVEDMTGRQYSDFLTLLSRAAQLVVSDMGTSTAGDVAVAALDAADQLVLCTGLRRRELEMALEFLSALHGQPVSYRPDPEDYASIADGRYAELAGRAIIVVSPGGGDPAALAPLLDWFAAATNAGRDSGRVVVVPHDPHIGRGEQIQLGQLQPATRLAYLHIAAHVVDNFPLGRIGTRRLPPAPTVLPALAVGPSPGRPTTAEPASPGSRGARPDPARLRAPGRTGPAAPLPSGQIPGAADAGSAAWPLGAGPAASAVVALGAAPAAQRPARLVGPGVGDAAQLVLGRELAGVLGVEHTEGEVCTGCAVRGCSWPVPPPSPAGAGERT